jgi:uncharacterized protein (TIGR02453 family)
MTFTHFPSTTFDYLERLSQNNTKEWFEAHREEYEQQYLAPAMAFVEAFGPRLEKHIPSIGYEARKDGRGSNQRIHRDIRFSKDKTPYKDNLMFEFWGGPEKKRAVSEFYMRIDRQGSRLLVGIWGFDKDQIAVYRQEVDRNGAELQALLKKLLVGGNELYTDQYVKVPKEYAEDHPHADLLRNKGLAVISPWITPAQLTSPNFLDILEGHAARLAPLHLWLMKVFG